MLRFFYQLILNLFDFLLYFSPKFNGKWGLWVLAQRKFPNIAPSTFKSIWFHIASSGEFEQAKPVIEELKTKGERIVVTFFSPSGYVSQKNNKILDEIYYLPLDTKKNAKRLITEINPKCCFFVKYDFWLNYMTELNMQQIPQFLISGVFTKDHFFFKWYGKEHLKQFKEFSYISVQDEKSQKNLESICINSELTSDTRIDRSLQLPTEEYENDIIMQFSKKRKTIIIGSAWKNDLVHFKNILPEIIKNYNLLIAPHELDSEFITWIVNEFGGHLLSNPEPIKGSCLIIDRIGILKYIYRYADIAFIGGGFGNGIHNTLEPASYGIPVLFGPNYEHFIEANEMVKTKGAFPIKNSDELLEVLTYLRNDTERKVAGEQAISYLINNQGATKKIIKSIKPFLNKSGE